jgi:hypothetical protein
MGGIGLFTANGSSTMGVVGEYGHHLLMSGSKWNFLYRWIEYNRDQFMTKSRLMFTFRIGQCKVDHWHELQRQSQLSTTFDGMPAGCLILASLF